MARRQGGAIAIMTVGALILIIAFFGLALDLSMVHNRRMELQNVADFVALSAAAQLDGTPQGVTNARDRAADHFATEDDGAIRVQYYRRAVAWSDSALTFSAAPSGPWLPVGLAGSAENAPNMLFARVETRDLEATVGQVGTVFMRFFSDDLSMVSTSARAVAGRSAIKVTPLGICAMHGDRNHNRSGELMQYGFRRGVAYNLMDLNPGATTPAVNFLVNPVPGATMLSETADIAPFMCTGTMALSRITGGSVAVSSPFPLGRVYRHLNSRFGNYPTSVTAPCSSLTAPPDVNIKEFTYNGGSQWMAGASAMTEQSAKKLEAGGKRGTVAGPEATPAGTLAKDFGPLWSYAKAVKYPESDDGDEPAGGFETYGTGDWATLYDPGRPAAVTTGANAYPTDAAKPTPFFQEFGSPFYRTFPFGTKGQPGRRVLNIPLLACPVTGSSANVLAIGRFFMTVYATDQKLFGEFAGLVSDRTLGTKVELYP